MLIDADALPADHLIDADVAVIGAGAAGITIARALADSPHQVLLLEGGRFDPTVESQSLYRGQVEPEQFEGYLAYSRLRYFGGTTNHWAGWCRPLQSQVFAPRPWVPHSGWPITRQDLDPWYDQAADVVQIPVFPHDESIAHAQTAPLATDPERLQTVVFHYSPPTRFGTEYREELIASDNVRMMLDANVLRIRCEPSARAVSHLELRTMAGRRLTARARAVILATGGIENARLLLLSDTEQPGGLGNGNDLVGRFFSDHPEVESGQIYLAPDARLYAAPVGQPAIRGVLVPPPEVLAREGILAGALQIRALADELDTPIDQAVAQLVSSTWDPSHPRRRAPKGGQFRLQMALEPAPNPESRVVLGEARDAFGQRSAELRWRLTELDRTSYRRHLQLATQELGRILAGRLHVSEGRWGDNIAPGQHHMGTTRMADDASQGVVDSNCRVHGIDNLWIAGSSVFPTMGFANPTLTVVALALRLAEHVQSVLSK